MKGKKTWACLVWNVIGLLTPSPNGLQDERDVWTAYVRYTTILTWLRGFRDKIANFLRLHCLAIPRRDLSTKKTKPNIEKFAMLEFWCNECGLFTEL